MPAAMYFAGKAGSAKENNYIENGRLVTCTVESVVKIGKTSNVTVTYPDENGMPIQARATANKSVRAGDVFEAYVLPETPNEVFRPADKVLKLIFIGLVAVIALIGWLLPVLYFVSLNKYNMLVKKGRPAEAEVTAYNRFDKNNLFCTFRFTDEDGMERETEIYVPANSAEQFVTYSIRYYIKPNGKVEAAITDARLLLRR